jgi:SAM-dependent methyltransferase
MTPLPPFTLNAWLRYDLIERTLAQLDGIESILEVGAGRGALGTRLATRFRYVGVEPDELSCEAAKEALGRVGTGEMVCGDLSALPPGDVFDAVCAFEVLEHIEDDAAALRAWRERLRPDGRLLMSVPLYQRRFAAADRFVGHFRRYDPDPLGGLLRESGFADVELTTFGFPLGHVLEKSRNLLARMAKPDESREERTGASGRRFQPTGRKGLVTQGLSAPFRYAQRPFYDTRLGAGLFAVARRDG